MSFWSTGSRRDQDGDANGTRVRNFNKKSPQTTKEWAESWLKINNDDPIKNDKPNPRVDSVYPCVTTQPTSRAQLPQGPGELVSGRMLGAGAHRADKN